MRPWIAPVALVLVSSAYPLVQVGLDRASSPRQTFTLTQRELNIQYQSEENSGLSLNWNWGTVPQLDSVSRDDVAGLGIYCRRNDQECDPDRERRGWVVIGLDTLRLAAVTDTARRQLDSVRRLDLADSLRRLKLRPMTDRLDQLVLHTSRLAMVAVGSDPEVLAARYGDGAHLILPARLHAWRTTWPADTLPGREPFYRVYAQPVPPGLYVPREWAGMVRSRPGDDRGLYRVTVAVGRRWLPRVTEVVPEPAPRTEADSLRLFGIDIH